MLVEQARIFERVYIFVDALDRMDRKLVFSLLDALDEFQSSAKNVSIMVSSPEILEYRQRLSFAREHNVYADQEELARFVRCRIARSAHSTMYRMALEDKELESNIQTTIEKKADGMSVL
jgi:hypothetical protein